MESQQAIMENENNSNLESQSINRERELVSSDSTTNHEQSGSTVTESNTEEQNTETEAESGIPQVASAYTAEQSDDFNKVDCETENAGISKDDSLPEQDGVNTSCDTTLENHEQIPVSPSALATLKNSEELGCDGDSVEQVPKVSSLSDVTDSGNTESSIAPQPAEAQELNVPNSSTSEVGKIKESDVDMETPVTQENDETMAVEDSFKDAIEATDQTKNNASDFDTSQQDSACNVLEWTSKVGQEMQCMENNALSPKSPESNAPLTHQYTEKNIADSSTNNNKDVDEMDVLSETADLTMEPLQSTSSTLTDSSQSLMQQSPNLESNFPESQIAEMETENQSDSQYKQTASMNSEETCGISQDAQSSQNFPENCEFSPYTKKEEKKDHNKCGESETEGQIVGSDVDKKGGSIMQGEECMDIDGATEEEERTETPADNQREVSENNERGQNESGENMVQTDDEDDLLRETNEDMSGKKKETGVSSPNDKEAIAQNGTEINDFNCESKTDTKSENKVLSFQNEHMDVSEPVPSESMGDVPTSSDKKATSLTSEAPAEEPVDNGSEKVFVNKGEVKTSIGSLKASLNRDQEMESVCDSATKDVEHGNALSVNESSAIASEGMQSKKSELGEKEMMETAEETKENENMIAASNPEVASTVTHASEKPVENEQDKTVLAETNQETNGNTLVDPNTELASAVAPASDKPVENEQDKTALAETNLETNENTLADTNTELASAVTPATDKPVENEQDKTVLEETNQERNGNTSADSDTNAEIASSATHTPDKPVDSEHIKTMLAKTIQERNENKMASTNSEVASTATETALTPALDKLVEDKQNVRTSEETNQNELIDARNIKKELVSEEFSASSRDAADATKSQTEVLRNIKQEVGEGDKLNKSRETEDEVVVLNDDGERLPVKKEVNTSAVIGQEQTSAAENTSRSSDTKDTSPKKSKSKTQTCIVCLKISRCKYNIVRNGDIKHLCGDECFKKFRKTPSTFLRQNKDGKTPGLSQTTSSQLETSKITNIQPKTSKTTSSQSKDQPNLPSDMKTCSVCHLMNVNSSQPFCNWKGLDFCGESCLGKFQANLNSTCSFCQTYIPFDMRATFCLKIGNDMRPFCKQACYNEFKKNLRFCAFCQKDLSSTPGAFSAMVGSLDKKVRQFCSQPCRQKLEAQIVDVEVVSQGGRGREMQTSSALLASLSSSVPAQDTYACSVCQKIQAVKHTIRYQEKVTRLCSDLCLSAFQYTNKISLTKCDSCGTVCSAEEAQAHFVQFEGLVKRFCGDACVINFRRDNSKIVSCAWCATKKMNFDMIERLDAANKYQLFCSLNCLSLYRVNLQAKSNLAVLCNQCKAVTPAQYHLTMSDASVRNFCSYHCVMTFQSQFTKKHLPQAAPLMPGQLPSSQPAQATSKGRGRVNTRQANKQQSPSFPVISNVVSLAPSKVQPTDPAPAPAPSPVSTNQQSTPASGTNTLASGDGKHQIIIQAPPVKLMRNKSLQCRPASMTKATSCRPHSQSKEIQTDEEPDKQVLVPIPVPIYIPMPTVMYQAPAPIPVPFPIPIPVPVFIPTTRKSVSGIMKTITEIVERMPSDPLEAELLMMAEAVASDKKESESESDGDGDFGVGFDDEPVEQLPNSQKDNEAVNLRKREGQGEEDMIQMALRMAEEMSGPIGDLESSVEPVAVNTEPPAGQARNIQVTPEVYQTDEDYLPPGARGRGRPAKRPGRGRTPSRPKRQRIEKSYVEENNSQIEAPEPQPVVPQQVEPAPDASYRLKFTYGVNAWRHWVMAKNAQIEDASKKNNSLRVRTFPTDILKCTTDQLDFSLVLFIKEVRKPNGEEYSPDSIYYLCLGIQQYLYENGRIDSIFTDSYFDKFADNLHEILKTLQPKVNSQGQMLCRIEEEHLWESKQLGAHSPFVLLNTLIYFHTKHFILKTAPEHMSLSFAQILKHWKKGVPIKGQAASGKNIALRFYCLANGKKDALAAKKNKEGLPVFVITENQENPLRCPVKLYEFFLSKCPESIKNRNDIFYPVPERSCVPDSPVWYSTQSIGHHIMEKMLTRVLLVREIQEAHLHAQPVYL